MLVKSYQSVLGIVGSSMVNMLHDELELIAHGTLFVLVGLTIWIFWVRGYPETEVACTLILGYGVPVSRPSASLAGIRGKTLWFPILVISVDTIDLST